MAGRPRKTVVSLPRHHHYSDIGGKRVLHIDRDAIKLDEENRTKVGTPERLRKAAGVTVGGDQVQRLICDPLEVLASRRALSGDLKRNGILHEAGIKFRNHWHNAGLTGIGAQDLNKVAGASSGPAWSIPQSQHAADHRAICREAIAYLGAYLAKWVVAIVIEERRPEEVGRNMSSYIDEDTARAIAIECLRAGLTTLADHWGLFGRPLLTASR